MMAPFELSKRLPAAPSWQHKQAQTHSRAKRLESEAGAALPSRSHSPSCERKQTAGGGGSAGFSLWALIYCPAPGCCCWGQGLIVPQWGLFLIEQPEIWDLTHPNSRTILFPAAPVNEACRLLPTKVSSSFSGGPGREDAAGHLPATRCRNVTHRSPQTRSLHTSSWRNKGVWGGCQRPSFA